MPRNTSGTYTQPAGTQAVTNTAASSSAFNTLESDIGNEITNSVDRLGRGTMLAALNLGGFTITNIGAPVNSTDAARKQDVIPSGTAMLFAQATAPVGWTQNVSSSVNGSALRIVNGNTGGTVTAGEGLQTWLSGGTSGHALTVAEMPSHNHSASDSGHAHGLPLSNGIYAAGGGGNIPIVTTSAITSSLAYAVITVANNGGGGAHTHAFPNLQYMDLLLASKN